MSAARNKQIAIDFLTAISKGELARAKAMMTEDATWQSPPSLAGGPFRGREAVFGTYIAIDDQLFETGTRSYDFEILNAIAEGDSVASAPSGSSRQSQPTQEMMPDGLTSTAPFS